MILEKYIKNKAKRVRERFGILFESKSWKKKKHHSTFPFSVLEKCILYTIICLVLYYAGIFVCIVMYGKWSSIWLYVFYSLVVVKCHMIVYKSETEILKKAIQLILMHTEVDTDSIIAWHVNVVCTW